MKKINIEPSMDTAKKLLPQDRIRIRLLIEFSKNKMINQYKKIICSDIAVSTNFYSILGIKELVRRIEDKKGKICFQDQWGVVYYFKPTEKIEIRVL